MTVDMEKVKAFFFEAMIAGWISDLGANMSIPHLPGYKCFDFRTGEFRLVDAFTKVSGSRKSHGFTTIWVNDVPVWTMHYGGYYAKTAIDFLKEALRRSYEQKIFTGGRGPLLTTQGNLQYGNTVRRNDFARFEGQENIIELNNTDRFLSKELGYHDYFGGSLLPDQPA